VIASLALLAYAGLLGAWRPRRANWADRAPRLGILIWLTAITSVLTALVLAGLVLLIPVAETTHAVARIIDASHWMVRQHYGGVSQPTGAIVGLGAALAVIAWSAGHALRTLMAAAWRRRGHLKALTLVAEYRPDLGAVVVEHPEPAVYCLAGRRRRIVVTTGAIVHLDDRQLGAVLEHERAHLRGRHHLVLGLSAAAAAAFPFRLFKAAHAEIVRLVELLADDAAARNHGHATVAAALVTLVAGRTPAAALGAGGSTTLTRVRRMLAPRRPLPPTARALGTACAGLLLMLPAILAAHPALAAAIETSHY
jgi:Zn-dependent protease with chaperone function